MFQSIDLEFSSKHAATAARDILGDSLVRVLQNLRTSWITTVMAYGGSTIAQLN